MRCRYRVWAIGIGLLVTCAAGPAFPGLPTEPADTRGLMIEIEESLVCQCGCGLTVHSCNHLNCPSGIPMKEEISRRLADGESAEQILAYFANKYGEKVLSAPTMRGFNLVAWITPLVFFVVGSAVVVRVARRWLRETDGGAEASPAPLSVDDADRDRLRREIDEFDRS